MPLIRNGTTNDRRASDLTQQLASELSSPGKTGEPLVYENQIGQTQSYHVTVVWNEWDDFPLQSRSRIILDAYEQAAPEKTGKIRIAMGLTWPEAISMGIFPFSVKALLKENDPAELKERTHSALIEESAIEIGGGPQLRFRTLKEAQEAFERLQKLVPGPHWVISQEASAN